MKSTLLTIIICLSVMVSANAQCYPDRHSTSVYDGWVSDTKTNNPNTIRGLSHWIMYDLGSTYNLGQSHFWNLNDPDRLSQGMQNFIIDISSDGTSWTELGEFSLSQAPGISTYEGEIGPDLQGEKANYILLTVKDNFADGAITGFSEMKIELSSAALAINLLDFSIECSVENVPRLEWTAIADSASEYFLVEQSLNGIDWEELAEIPVTGLGSEETYLYSAEDTPDNFTYRLSSVDNDGSLQFLQLASTACKKKRSFDVWPNPFNESAEVKLSGFEDKSVTYLLHDVLGRIAQSGRLNVISDDQSFSISSDGLASGQYVLSINDGFETYKKTIIYVAQK